MASNVQDVGQYTVAANANARCFDGAGTILGILVSSASNTPLLTVKDEPAAANSAGNLNAVVQTFVPTVGFLPVKAMVRNGLQVINSGNVVYTVIWNR